LKYAESVINSDMYRYEPALSPNIKSVRKLEWFDCIAAPCVHGCPTNQDIPDYLYYAGKGLYDEALEVILKKNPFPSVLGAVCTHFCQYKCTRINYDNPILIRDIKRYIVENATKEPLLTKSPDNGLKVAIIGAGPSGLSCAFFLILEGFKVDVYETKDSPGGMIADAIPTFRLQTNALKKDIDRISSLGVNFYWNYKITSNEFEKIQKEYDYIYIAVGAQKNRKLNIEGEELEGVIDPLEFLSAVKKGKNIKLGSKIAVIGGGNTAVDVARTAKRLVGGKGEVTLLYRRTRLEMPAGYEEIKDLIEENIIIKELVAPERISGENGKVKQMVLSMMKIEGVDSQGRPKPVKIPNSEITLDFDAIIPALGQEVDINFIDISSLKPDFKTYRTAINNIFIGGDAMRGAATIVNAVADGRKVAEIIMLQARIENKFKYFPLLKNRDISQHMLMRSRRIKGIQHNNRHNKLDFDIILKSFNPNQVKEEASRCLFCDEFCNICVTVCPNRANYSYSVKPQQYQLQKLIRNTNGEMVAYEDTVFVV
ncbi:MAG TPA: FAD-dependent oxidoreductase, partial [Bacteroidales bacterium]|nr:FAD-dependent oxidoreductase [Bacteroidales bacterium]